MLGWQISGTTGRGAVVPPGCFFVCHAPAAALTKFWEASAGTTGRRPVLPGDTEKAPTGRFGGGV